MKITEQKVTKFYFIFSNYIFNEVSSLPYQWYKYTWIKINFLFFAKMKLTQRSLSF